MTNHGATPRFERRPGQETSLVKVGDVVFGGHSVVIIGGPCSVESREQILDSAKFVAAAGGHMLRGGVWKPRTSPYSFQGIGSDGLALLASAGKINGLPVITEVLDPRKVELVAGSADMLQIGSRSIQNFPLLKEAGASGMPILLKRGMMTTLEEWLNAAEYILLAGGKDLVLCERGIRTFDPTLRNTLDVGGIAYLKERTHLPVIADPSHAAGDRRFVGALARAAVAAGADGLLVEAHPIPDEALSDARQSLTPREFQELVISCRAVAQALGRNL